MSSRRTITKADPDQFRDAAKMVPKIPDSMCLLSCRCGHECDFEEFTRTPVTGPLPAGTFQCPSCGHAWQMQAVEPGKLYESGLYIPATRRAVAVPSFL